MARAATTTDVFNALAEPRRRQIVDLLSSGERTVGDLVHQLGWEQPLVSKHLRVLLDVSVVQVRDEGRQRFYRLNASALEPMYLWVRRYAHLWSERFDRMDAVLAELQQQETADDDPGKQHSGDGDPSQR